ncbi:hypothetical protein SAMN04488515_2999 [Cognatiyoonia koreensis]|uniref:Uncharacterized protein n=1 Tax=Cognatiyoonia koreensis TaxID=364200 RepID=A0A1I0RNC4_9RHOB|nr:hypothetical protein [Cognatiyoonia koreensis]SEW42771.1 hypothetical protein SAMN04488515_2999 [Cognatiyoonia koreensis]
MSRPPIPNSSARCEFGAMSCRSRADPAVLLDLIDRIKAASGTPVLPGAAPMPNQISATKTG